MYLKFPQIVYFPLISPGSPTPKCYASSEEVIFTRKQIPWGKRLYCILNANPAMETADILLVGWISEIHNLVQNFSFTQLAVQCCRISQQLYSSCRECEPNLYIWYGL